MVLSYLSTQCSNPPCYNTVISKSLFFKFSGVFEEVIELVVNTLHCNIVIVNNIEMKT